MRMPWQLPVALAFASSPGAKRSWVRRAVQDASLPKPYALTHSALPGESFPTQVNGASRAYGFLSFA